MMMQQSERGRQLDFVAKQKCPKCKVQRLLAGPDYDRWRVRCLNCGFLFRMKVRQTET